MSRSPVISPTVSPRTIVRGVATPRVCIFAPIPPPWHGSAYAVQLLLQSNFAREVSTSHINTVYTTEIANLGKAELHKILRFGRYLLTLLRTCRREDADFVILTPAFTFLPFVKDSMAVLVAAALSGARVILWSHSNDVLPFYRSRGRILRAYVRFVIGRATHVVTLGESLRSNFTAFLPQDRVSVIPNGLPPREVARVRSDGSRLEVIYLSNMIRSKGWLTLLGAAKRLCAIRSDIAFTFYGAPSGDSPIQLIREAFDGAEAGNRIRYAGPVFGEEKEAALARADVFCLPTAYPTEALPISILEAMQYGLAVVSTPMGAIREAVGSGGILVSPDCVDELVRALAHLADHRDVRERMGVANRARFSDHFAMDRIAEQWVDLVSRLKVRTDEC